MSRSALKYLEEDQEIRTFQEIVETHINPYEKTGERPYLERRLYLPKLQLRKAMLRDNHILLFGSYGRRSKTTSRTSIYTYCPTMKKAIDDRVHGGLKRQQAKRPDQRRPRTSDSFYPN